MSEVLTIIFDYPREGKFAFDIVFRGKRFEHHRDSKEGCHFAAGIRKTAERFGFRYILARNCFQSAFETTGAEPLNLITALQKQGYNLRIVGGLNERNDIQNAA